MSTETLERPPAPAPPTPGGTPRAAASIAAAPVEVAPGEVANATVSVTNRAEETSDFTLSLAGLEPGWYHLAERTGPVAPGATVDVPLQVSLPRGHPPCSLLVGLEARPIGAGPGHASADDGELPGPGRLDLRVVVGDGATVVARLDPPDIAGGRRARFTLRLRNRGAQSQQVRVDGVSPDAHLELHFDPAAPLLLPGKETAVKGRVHAKRPVFGEPQRHPFTVRVQGRGSPTMADGSYTLHPWLPKWASKSLVMGLVIVLWAAVAIVGIQALSRHLHQAASQKAAVAPAPTHHRSHSTAPNSAGHKSTSPGAPGTTAPGTSSPKKSAKTTSSSSSSPGSTVEVTGKVGGHAPGGVTVTLAPTSLVSTQLSNATPTGGGATLASSTGASATGASSTGASSTGAVMGRGHSAMLTALTRGARDRRHDRPVDTASRHSEPAATPMLVGASQQRDRLPDVKVYGTEAAAAFFPGLTAAIEPTLTTVTAPDGSFVFTGVKAPGTYLVSFTEPGYNTRKYVVQTSSGKSVSLDTVLTPGTGSISGIVGGPNGPLGGVTITVTNGADTFTTVTPTTGPAIGTWSVSGLNTPDTYSVSASAPGYGTQVTNATLAASASLAGVDLTLAPGVGSISGTVTAATSGKPVGDVTVSATDGSTTVSATTSTVTPVGTYTLPDLAIPATWTLTIAGTSWLTQTQAVALGGNVTLNASLTHSGANVVGVVSSGGTGLGNVGLELTSSSATFKSLSESAAPVGGFDFGQVPPGQYVLKATKFGYTTQSASIDLRAGTTKTVDLTLPFVGQASVKTGTITGSVVNEFTGAPVSTVPIELDGKSTSAKTNANGVYTLGDVAPGLHEVTALGTTKGFADAGTQVSVAEGATVTAPVIALPALSSLSGLVTSAATGTPIPTPTVSLLEGGSALGTPVHYSSTKIGTYQITDITAGNYVLKVSAPGFDPSDTNVSIGPGQALTQNVSLTQGPTFRARTYLVSTNGTLTPKGGVCVVVARTEGSGKTSTAVAALTRTQGTSTPTGGRATFTDLVAGDTYVATFALPKATVHLANATGCKDLAPTKVTARAPSHVFTAKPDNTTIYGAVLSPAHAHISVELEFPYVVGTGGATGTGHTTDCPVEATSTPSPPCPEVAATTATLPTVTVTGTTGYGSQTNGTPGTAQTRTVTLTHQTADIWTWTTTSTTFVGTQVELTVRDPAGQFETLQKTVTLPAAGTTAPTLTELLTPVPVPVTGTITPASGVTVTVHPDQIGPTSTTGSANTLTAPDTIGATEGPKAQLQWSDPATTVTGAAQPGKYTLSLSASGYETTGQVSVTIPLCQGLSSSGGCKTTFSVASGTLTLTQEATLTVVARDVPVGTGLGRPSVSLEYTANGNTSAVATSPKTMTVTTKTGTATATFPDALRPTTAKSGAYTYAISGPGFKTQTGTVAFATGTFTGSTSGTVTETVTLVQTGWLSGRLEGILVPGSSGSGTTEPLSGARVTATPAPPATGCQTLSATTGTNGTFLLVGTTGGLCPTHTYVLTVTKDTGFTGGGSTASVKSGLNTLSAPLEVTATPITQEVEVEGLAKKATVTVSAVSAVGPTERCSITIPTTGTTATTSCTTSSVSASASTSGAATFTFHLDPVTYSFTLAAPTYQTTTLGPVPYAPAEKTTPITYVMTRQLVTITGTVTVSATGSQSGAVPIGDLPLTLESTTNATFTEPATTATATSTKGTYTFSTVPLGDYKIVPGDTYTTLQPISLSTGTASQLTEDFTVYAPPVPVTLTLKDPVAGLANGAALELEPTTTATPESCGSHKLLEQGLGSTETTTAVGASSEKTAKASFSDVVPGVYTVSVSVGTANDKPSIATRTLTVCPSPATAVATTPATFTDTLGIGTVTATVTLETPPASLPTVTVSAPTLSVTCTPSGASCTATLRVPLGAHTITASAPGYGPSTTSVTLSATAPTKSVDFTLSPATATLALTVAAPSSSNTAVVAGTKGATVVLTRSTAGTQSLTSATDTTGVATFTVAKTAHYAVSVKPNLTGATAETLGTVIATTATTAKSVTLETGNATGKVTLSTAATATETVSITADGASCGSTTIAKTKTTSATYTCVLPPGTYTLVYTTTQTTTKYSATKTVKVTATRTTSTENVTITT